MYKVKPFEDKIAISCIPTCIYKTKCYFDSTYLKFDDELAAPMANLSLVQLEELTKQQDKQFRRLERLINRSKELCDDLKLSDLVIPNVKMENDEANKLEQVFEKQEALFKKIENLTLKVKQTCEEMGVKNLLVDFEKMDIKSAEIKTKEKRQSFKVDLAPFKSIDRASSKLLTDRNVEDLVIYADPFAIPLELINLFDLLSLNAKAFAKFHIHSSLSNGLANDLENRLLNIEDLFEGLRLGINNNRVDYDLGFTFIWRKMESNEPKLKFSNGNLISGEEKIVDYVNELLPLAKRVSKESLKKNQASSPLLKILKSF